MCILKASHACGTCDKARTNEFVASHASLLLRFVALISLEQSLRECVAMLTSSHACGTCDKARTNQFVASHASLLLRFAALISVYANPNRCLSIHIELVVLQP